MTTLPLMERGAELSPCRTYRYLLWRVWDTDGSPLNVIGLNPSTADENVDDPTIRRCIDFAQRWGYGSLVMTNLFAYRSTDPKGLLRVDDPVGPDNDAALRLAAWRAGLTVAAWGAHRLAVARSGAVSALLHWMPVDCFGTTKDGAPKHPLYLPKSTEPVPFWTAPRPVTAMPREGTYPADSGAQESTTERSAYAPQSTPEHRQPDGMWICKRDDLGPPGGQPLADSASSASVHAQGAAPCDRLERRPIHTTRKGQSAR